ncbi:MAG: glycoside hydrolase family 3 N-terminal domain-containing protein [Promethearchaeota archaeon]
MDKRDNTQNYKNPELSIDSRVEDLIARMTLEEKVNELNLIVDLNSKKIMSKMDAEDVTAIIELFSLDSSNGISFELPGGSVWDEDGNFSEENAKKAFTEFGRSAVWGMAVGPEPKRMAEIANSIQKIIREETRLGIPALICSEGLHGHTANGATIFPQAIGMASTWNPELIQNIGSAIADEARAVGVFNLWHPVLDVSRDPRWGRTEETYGEDALLAAKMGVAMVKGLQGDKDSINKKTIATLKHFGGHGSPLGGRDSNMVGMSTRDMYEYHLVPFRSAVEEAGALSIMPAYHALDGIPCTSNSWLLDEVLRQQWGFEGFTVSDAGALEHLRIKHAVVADQKEAIKLALEAGLDMHNNGSNFREPLVEMVEAGLVAVETVDKALRRILRIKFILGLFDEPFVDPSKAEEIVNSQAHKDLALETARQSIVLLKNTDGILPLSKQLGSVLITGPNADDIRNQLGDYSGSAPVVSILEGIKEKIDEHTEVRYVKGCGLKYIEEENISEAAAAAKESKLVIAVVGGSSAIGKNITCGEAFDRATLGLPGRQQELLESIFETGTPLIVILVNGRPLTINWAVEHVPAIVEAWYPGQEGGHAVADILFGDVNPSGKLPITFPREVGQLPLFYNQKPSGRKNQYNDLDEQGPLFAFGHGLSFTTFEYKNLEIVPSIITPAGTVSISLDVQNTGKIEGDEIVQLYLNDVVSSVVTPTIELKGFERVSLAPGETKKVSFQLGQKELALLNRHLEWIVEPGWFAVMVGNNSADIRLKGKFSVSLTPSAEIRLGKSENAENEAKPIE